MNCALDAYFSVWWEIRATGIVLRGVCDNKGSNNSSVVVATRNSSVPPRVLNEKIKAFEAFKFPVDCVYFSTTPM